jgi:hypothetical protein
MEFAKGILIALVCILAIVGAVTCVCMVIDAYHGIAAFRRTRRKLREMRRG